MHAAHFEDVGKIGIECNREWNFERGQAVVYEQELFVTPVLPKESRAQKVQSTSGDRHFVVVAGDVEIGQVGGEEKVIRRHS